MPDIQPLDAASVPIASDRPLLVVDVDEVLALFMQGFARHVKLAGYELRLDRFALFENIYAPGATAPVGLEVGRGLFDAFFAAEEHEIEPAPGAAESLRRLSARAQVVVLTNAPGAGHRGRSAWLQRHGFDYPLLLNAGLKGPALAVLTARTGRASAFVDDLIPNLDSGREAAPGLRTFQMVADPVLRRFAPSAPDRHPRIDDWADLEPALEEALAA